MILITSSGSPGLPTNSARCLSCCCLLWKVTGRADKELRTEISALISPSHTAQSFSCPQTGHKRSSPGSQDFKQDWAGLPLEEPRRRKWVALSAELLSTTARVSGLPGGHMQLFHKTRPLERQAEPGGVRRACQAPWAVGQGLLCLVRALPGHRLGLKGLD